MRLCALAVFVAMVGTEAEAGCKKLRPSGPTICASWIPGSLLCESLLKGVKATLAKDCNFETGENCPVDIQCEVFGTTSSASNGDPQCTSDTFLDPDAVCEIEGRLACCNPQFKYNEEGTAFNLLGPAKGGETTTLCGKGGKCFDSSDVEFNIDDVCNNNWTPEFTPTSFKGQICVCPGGFDDSEPPQCCADTKRDGAEGSETCVNLFGDPPGEAGCIQELCTIAEEVDLTFCDDVATEPIEYKCDPLTLFVAPE